MARWCSEFYYGADLATWLEIKVALREHVNEKTEEQTLMHEFL